MLVECFDVNNLGLQNICVLPIVLCVYIGRNKYKQTYFEPLNFQNQENGHHEIRTGRLYYGAKCLFTKLG